MIHNTLSLFSITENLSAQKKEKKQQKKRFGLLCLSVSFFSFFLFGHVFAHPLDISSTVLSYHTDTVNATTYFHSYEIQRLLSQNNIESTGVGSFFENRNIIETYVYENIRISNNDILCPIRSIVIPDQETHTILLDGLEVNYTFACPDILDTLGVEITFFLDFILQTNRLTLYNLKNGLSNITPVGYKVLNGEYTTFTSSIQDLDTYISNDSDGDGLSDEDELRYRTEVKNADSDGDGYNDYEEVYNSRDPLSKKLGPGQNKRDVDIPPIITEGTINQTQQSNNNNTLNDTNVFGAGWLNTALKAITDYATTGNTSIRVVFGMIVILGFIHAMGPGHAKNILMSYIIDKQKSLGEGLLFAGLFSLTHLLDVFILFLLVTVFATTIDFSQYTDYIQYVSAFLLFLCSIYLIYKARGKKSSVNHNSDNNEAHDDETEEMRKKKKKQDIKTTLWLSIVSGFAPCTFGWSILLLLLSLGRTDLLLPLLSGLGVGIFLCLSSIVFLTVFVRKKLYSRLTVFADYSQKISALLLFLISIIIFIGLLTQNFF